MCPLTTHVLIIEPNKTKLQLKLRLKLRHERGVAIYVSTTKI